jgi:hypothetical protein
MGTQTHCYLMSDFVARFRTVFDDNGELDKLSQGS